MKADAGVPDHEDEVLDLVGERGETIGSARRGDCHGDPSLAHRAVHVFVRNSRGDVFLQRRSTSKRIQPGRWDTSVGGHLAPGERYEEAALRELREELGVGPAAGSALRRLHEYVWRSEIETEHVQTFVVEHDGPFEPDAGEIEEGRFWTEAEIRGAVGTGLLTPNLEEELRLLGVVGAE